MMRTIRDICHHNVMKHRKCGVLFSFIIRQLYLDCKCNNTYDYITHVLSSPCMDLFNCTTVAEIFWQPLILMRLNQQERNFLSRIKWYHCVSLIRITNTIRFDITVTLGLLELLVILLIVFGFISYCPPRLTVMLQVQYLILMSYLVYTQSLNQEWMVWLADYFPLVFLRLKKLVLYAVLALYLYSGYTHRFVEIYNRTIELHMLELCNHHKLLFLSVVTAEYVFDVFIFWRFVPTCV